eukprot:558823-Rhodomonas_salina.3
MRSEPTGVEERRKGEKEKQRVCVCGSQRARAIDIHGEIKHKQPRSLCSLYEERGGLLLISQCVRPDMLSWS